MTLPPPLRPSTRAFRIAGLYALIGGSYILLSSGYLGERLGGSLEQANFEMLKGMAFVLLTAALLFLILRTQFASLLQAQQQLGDRARALAQAEQRASIALVASSVAHEMKNVLTVVLASHQQLADSPGPRSPEAQEALEQMGSALTRLRALSKELMQRSRPRPKVAERLDVGAVARDTIRLLHQYTRSGHCSITLFAAEPAWVLMARQDLEHVFLNLLLNAVECSAQPVAIELRVVQKTDAVEVSVLDSGPGIAPELRAHIFEPFFTTKGQSGNGLGLSIVTEILQRNQAHIALVPSEKGAHFVLRFPLPASPSA